MSSIYCHIEIGVWCIWSNIYFCQLGCGGCCYQTFGFLAVDQGGGLFVGFYLLFGLGFFSPSTISGSFRSLMPVLNLPSHFKPARGRKSEWDHLKISFSLHKSNSFTILRHNALKYACLARSLPAAFSRIACERSGDPWELFSSDSLGQCIRTDSSLSARWWLQKKIDTPFQTDFTQTLLRGASGNPAIRSVVNKYYKIVNYKRDV